MIPRPHTPTNLQPAHVCESQMQKFYFILKINIHLTNSPGKAGKAFYNRDTLLGSASPRATRF